MRVAAQHLVPQPGRDVVDVELTGLGRDRGVQVDLEQYVAELLTQVRGVTGLDRLEGLVGLLERGARAGCDGSGRPSRRTRRGDGA